MKKLKKTIAVVMTIVTVISCTGCGNSLYENHKENYTKVTSVDGVTFDMPENFLAQATAITNISKDEDYSANTYLYKDGENTYLLFNIGQVVVAVENQTGYRLKDATSVESAIKNNSLDGIWFDKIGKELSYDEENKNDVYKLIATVKGDVSVTTEVYGVFTGKFAYVSTNDYECSMFVGIRGEDYDSLDSNAKSIVEHITKSLAVTDGASTMPSQVQTETISTEQNQNNDDTVAMATETTENETESIEQIENTENVNTDMPESTEVSIPTEEIFPATEIEETTNTENTNNVKNEESDKNGLEISDNQGEVGSKYSDIYHLLSIGMTGLYHAYDKNAENSLSDGEITIEQLYTGDEAVDIIKNYCNSGKSMYKYTNPPAGYSWHVVKYSLSKSQNDLYTNIKIEGIDGERLVYRGISCTTRTYDIIYDWNKTTDLYCYYAVPNGCKEYMLECGDRYESTSETACFRINGF